MTDLETFIDRIRDGSEADWITLSIEGATWSGHTVELIDLIGRCPSVPDGATVIFAMSADDEVRAIEFVDVALRSLPPSAQHRVLTWASDRFYTEHPGGPRG